MGIPRYAARKDKNENEIVQALEDIGCSVLRVGKPVDLSVGYRARNFYLEVKSPDSKGYKGTDEQRDWIKNWRGQVRVVTSAEEAIKVVTEAYSESFRG